MRTVLQGNKQFSNGLANCPVINYCPQISAVADLHAIYTAWCSMDCCSLLSSVICGKEIKRKAAT